MIKMTCFALGILWSLSSATFAAETKDPAKNPAKKSKVTATQVKEKEVVQNSFTVQDMPRPEPIEGQLGEPGAPSLKEQQELLAKALLAKGLCNVSYYGADFCEKQQARTFKVTDQLGSTKSDTELLGEKTE